jgi:SAM-dependent methyltransferase
MHWRIKGVVQKVLGVLPGGTLLHYGLQRRFGGLRDFEREFACKVDDWSIMTRHLRNAGQPIGGACLVEIGTGWYPTFPLACYLAGARAVETFDLNRHLRPELTARCIELLGSHLEHIANASGADIEQVRHRYALLSSHATPSRDLEAATSGVIRYHAPADATRTGLPAGSIDMVFSNSVLEHVPPEVITGLYTESRRILAPGGLMFHSVNCGDHYAYVDRRLHQLHYLQYSSRAWSFWNNAFLYQNRLRAHHFVEDAAAAGFQIVLDTATARDENLARLCSMRVAPEFADIPRERLCITSVDFIGRATA